MHYSRVGRWAPVWMPGQLGETAGIASVPFGRDDETGTKVRAVLRAGTQYERYYRYWSPEALADPLVCPVPAKKPPPK